MHDIAQRIRAENRDLLAAACAVDPANERLKSRLRLIALQLEVIASEAEVLTMADPALAREPEMYAGIGL